MSDDNKRIAALENRVRNLEFNLKDLEIRYGFTPGRTRLEERDRLYRCFRSGKTLKEFDDGADDKQPLSAKK